MILFAEVGEWARETREAAIPSFKLGAMVVIVIAFRGFREEVRVRVKDGG
jgi:hypothetical protein